MAASFCDEWTGSLSHGYGQIRIGGRGFTPSRVHRIVWMQDNDQIPDGLEVRHKCDNRACCNIEHLELGTRSDNVQDIIKRGRGRNQNIGKTHCHKGHEFNNENVYLYKGKRHCKQCQTTRSKEFSRGR